MGHKTTQLAGYAGAVALVAACTALRWLIDPLANGPPGYLPCLIAVALVTYFGGTGPGLVTAALSAGADWTFSPAPGTGDSSGMALSLFAVAGATIILVIQRSRGSRDEARHALTAADGARQSAERTSRATEQFVARLSHEWRTPLNAMSIWVWQLEHRAADRDFVERAAANLRHAVDTGTRLVADLLDYTRGTGGKLSIEAERLAIDQPVKRALESTEAEMAKKQLTVHVFDRRGDAQVWGDPVRLEQVFANLLQNAIKFTPPGGTVLISYVVSEKTLQVTVTDTGMGIAADALATIFDPFTQTDTDRASSPGGLGLGLTIAKEIVELHGGSVTAWSAGKGKGSTFSVQLPLAVACDLRPEVNMSPSAGNSPH